MNITPHNVDLRSSLAEWLARRRIAITSIVFTILIVFNLVFVHTTVHNPLNILDGVGDFGLLLLLTGLAIRSWAAGTLRKNEGITVTGPYAWVRNPLYLGSFLMMIGFAILMNDWVAGLFVIGPMAWVYFAQVKKEEQYLKLHFPAEFKDHASRTGRFLPMGFSSFSFVDWSPKQWMNNREYQAVAGCMLGLIVLSAWSQYADISKCILQAK